MEVEAFKQWVEQSGKSVAEVAKKLRMTTARLRACLKGDFPLRCGSAMRKRMNELSEGSLNLMDVDSASGSQRLLAWLAKEQMTQRDFARLVGISCSTMSLVLRSRGVVSKKICKRICRATGDQVRLEDIYEEVD